MNQDARLSLVVAKRMAPVSRANSSTARFYLENADDALGRRPRGCRSSRGPPRRPPDFDLRPPKREVELHRLVMMLGIEVGEIERAVGDFLRGLFGGETKNGASLPKAGKARLGLGVKIVVPGLGDISAILIILAETRARDRSSRAGARSNNGGCARRTFPP